MQDTTHQIAQLIHVNPGGGILYALDIETAFGTFYRKPSRFRVRVYNINSLTGAPGSDLLQQVVEVQSEKWRNHIYMEPFNIRIRDTAFFVAVEMLRIPENENNIDMLENIPEQVDSAGNTIKPPNTYRPSVGLVKTESPADRIWFLTYNNVWHRPYRSLGHETAAIKATIKY